PPPPSPDDPIVTDMVRALGKADFKEVIALKDKIPASSPLNPWVDYNVGAALAGLNRTDEAIAAFERAEHAFGEADQKGRSLAIWGRARALANAGRCREARAAVEDYTHAVGASDPHAIRLATGYASDCK